MIDKSFFGKMASAKRNVVVVSIVLVIGIAIFYWQPIAAWFAPPPPKGRLTIALVNTYPGSGLLYVAAANGDFAHEGLDVTFDPYTSGGAAINAALQKRADLAASADIPVMFAALESLPVAIVATIFTTNRALGIVARRDRGIAGVADLKGKIVGVALRTDSHFVLGTMLARHQIALSDVRIKNLQPEDMLAALMTGKVDAISIWEPGFTTASKALAKNAAAFRAEGRFMFDFNLAGRADYIQANPDRIQRVLRAILRAKQFADSKPQEARAIIAKAMKIDSGIFDTIGPNYRFVLELNQNLLSVLEDQARWAIQNKLTDRTEIPNFLPLIYMDGLLAVQPDAVTIVR